MRGRKLKVLYMAAVVVFAMPLYAAARDIAPVVSGDWLEKNLNDPKLVIVDIRKVEEYKEGNIPNSVNVFFGTWAVKKNSLDNELPDDDDLFDTIGSAGITADSRVVLVGFTESTTDLVSLTRVAWTLIYAGIENVAILDGGFNKWEEAKKPISTTAVKTRRKIYQGKFNKAIFAPKAYILSKIGKATLVDARMPDVFFGISKSSLVAREGHIKGAASLPAVWIFTKEGTFKSKEELQEMAAGIVGKDLTKEIIAYCDTGRLCTGWWFVLREILGYEDVKSYDGSSQEYAKDPNAPMVKYRWCD
jgi:thiosulfate/3-mercaptopyruvate sulfurtransferase